MKTILRIEEVCLNFEKQPRILFQELANVNKAKRYVLFISRYLEF